MNEQKPLWFDSAVTQDEILSVMRPNHWYSVAELAKRLNRNKRHLYVRLMAMTSSDILERTTRRLPNGVDMLLYRSRN